MIPYRRITGSLRSAKPALVKGLFRVHHYEDALERMASLAPHSRTVARHIQGKIAADLRRHQLLFIHVPKNAGTSIAAAIYGRSPPHKSAHFYASADPAFFARSTVFAVMRDPVARFISAYWFVRKGGGRDVGIDDAFSCRFARIGGVDDLLAMIEDEIPGIYGLGNVLRPQWWYVEDWRGRLIVDNLFLLERDLDRLAHFLRGFGVAAIPIRNSTEKGELTLSARQRSRVLQLYARDAELYEQVRVCDALTV